jgi:hypothetical protein
MLNGLLSVLTACLLLTTAGNAQQRSEPTTSQTSTHGLRLLLKQESQYQKSDGSAVPREQVDACSKLHPLFACIPIRVTLKNEGDEIILRWFTTCPGGILDASFEVQNPDGRWESFRPGDLYNCASNGVVVQRIGPGESYEWTMKLADLGVPTAEKESRHFRMHWELTGCITTRKDVLTGTDPILARSQCLGRKEPLPRFVTLQSNAILPAADSRPK